jgi:AcrR family transcriptional regulator
MENSQGRPTTRQERNAETEAALKSAARDQFLQRGYLNTKITDITSAAGRSTGSFYDHFASKEALLHSLLTDMQRAASSELNPGEHPREHDLTDRAVLREHLAVTWHVMRSNLSVMIALFESSLSEGPASGRAWSRLVDDTDVLREHLGYLRDSGRTLPGEPTLVAAAMGGMLAMLAYSITPSSEGVPAEDTTVDTLTDLLLHGLTGPPKEAVPQRTDLRS